MTTQEILIGLLSALVMTLGFGFYFNQRIKHAIIASLVGMLTWGVYLLFMPATDNIFLLSAAATAFAGLASEVMARVLKIPASAFLTVAVVVLIPGRSLYYTLYYAIAGARLAATQFGIDTLLVVLGISAGIVFTSVCARAFTAVWNKFKK
ncbi:MAG: threonine/serine exporter family protein [Clostridia bacterium]|nr:threonine/serine exporter family protein [Clostridia bacterium]